MIVYSVLSGLAVEAQGMGEVSWPAYGNDPGGMRYSPLDQVNTGNVQGLRVAWSFRTGELEKYQGTGAMDKAAFEATPIMVGRTLYFSTPSDRVFALDAVSGLQKWSYDPQVDLHRDYSELTSRGVSSWPAGAGRAQLIFLGTIDGRLIALDAASGQKSPSFGEGGEIDLKKGLGNMQETSPPLVIGDLVVVGSSMGDNQRLDYPPGVIRAYNVHDGRLQWTWSPIPAAGVSARRYWQGNPATGGANAWSVLSADPARGLIFVPTTSPSPDYYGGERIGDNRCANSVVCLEAASGRMRWYFQVVHHDLWDDDIAAQPLLFDLVRKGRKMPAVAVGTKMGHVFILDRLNGRSLFPVEERPVPASAIPGETASATQPFPVLPSPLGIQRLSAADAWGPTPEDSVQAARRISGFINQGPFTPPSFQGSIMTPGNVGGIHWGGMCFDPINQVLITNINRLAATIRVIPREKLGEMEREDAALLRAETGRQIGTPYVMKRDYLFKADPDRGIIMQTKPPWGTLLAIDLHSGRQQWEVPLGYMYDSTRYPGAQHWGSINFGGAIVTAGNLIFVAASRDGHLRAFDRRDGTVRWEYELPAAAQATPMSYSVDGKQYIIIAAGGHGKLKTRMGDWIMAFSL